MLFLKYFKPFKTEPSGVPTPLSVIKNPYAIWLFNPLVSQAITDKNCMNTFKEGHCKKWWSEKCSCYNSGAIFVTKV